jgi:hypothetical protein
MRPRVICHMLSTVDGKIDGSILKAVIDERASNVKMMRSGFDTRLCGPDIGRSTSELRAAQRPG